MTWYIPFSRLSQTQQGHINRIVKSYRTGTQYISGFAGSGKSVLLANILERLRIDNPDASFAFLTYTHSLVGMARTSLQTAGLSAGLANSIRFSTFHSFKKHNPNVDFVFVDEVQDFEMNWLRTVKEHARYIFLAGDFDQSIYNDTVSKEQLFELFSPQTYELSEVFRLTPSLKKVALSINPDASRIVEAEAVNSVNADIRKLIFDSLENEVAWVYKEATGRALAGKPSVILFSTHKELQRFLRTVANDRKVPYTGSSGNKDEFYKGMNSHFSGNRIPISFYGNSIGDLGIGDASPHCYVMTIHSAKGLDFKNVFIPCIAVKNQSFDHRLSFVGVTRSYENLFLSGTDDEFSSPFDQLPEDVVRVVRPSTEAAGDDAFFF